MIALNITGDFTVAHPKRRYLNDEGLTRYLKTKLCRECGKEFSPSKLGQKYCGYSCSNKVTNREKSLESQVELTCQACSKRFSKRLSDIKIYENYKGKTRGRFCSKKCQNDLNQSISSLKKRAWNSFSLYIRRRDNWTCYTCGKVGNYTENSFSSGIHAGHFISRSHNSTLFDEMNVHAQCAGCNTYRNGEPHIYAGKLIEEYGLGAFKELLERGQQIKKFTREELLEIHHKYANLNKNTA